jgi:hypothetical protein
MVIGLLAVAPIALAWSSEMPNWVMATDIHQLGMGKEMTFAVRLG